MEWRNAMRQAYICQAGRRVMTVEISQRSSRDQVRRENQILGIQGGVDHAPGPGLHDPCATVMKTSRAVGKKNKMSIAEIETGERGEGFLPDKAQLLDHLDLLEFEHDSMVAKIGVVAFLVLRLLFELAALDAATAGNWVA